MQNEDLPTTDRYSSDDLKSNNIDSFPPKTVYADHRNVQPDILTHGNQRANVRFHTSQEFDQNSQTSIADKKSISSLYVDMIPDNFSQSDIDHHDISSSNDKLNRDNENVASIPVFVTLLRVPINNVLSMNSSLNATTWNKNREIRLGTIYFSSLKPYVNTFLHKNVVIGQKAKMITYYF